MFAFLNFWRNTVTANVYCFLIIVLMRNLNHLFFMSTYLWKIIKKKSFIHFPLQDCIPLRSSASQILFRSSSRSSLHDFTSSLTNLKVGEEKDITSLLLPIFIFEPMSFFLHLLPYAWTFSLLLVLRKHGLPLIEDIIIIIPICL